MTFAYQLSIICPVNVLYFLKILSCIFSYMHWLRTLTFDLGGHRDCQSCASWYFVRVPSANFVVWPTQVRHTMSPCWPWPLTLEVMALAPDASLRPPSPHQLWSLYALPFGRYGTFCVSALVGLWPWRFDLWPLTLKLVCESHLRWGTFLPNLGTLSLWVLELFVVYATDGRTDKSNAYCLHPSLRGGA